MRFNLLARTVTGLLAAAPLALASVPAHATAPCPAVGPAPAASAQFATFNVHGYGGGTIGGIALPFVSGVTPQPTAYEGDAVAVLTYLNFPGYLTGGTTTINSLPGGGATTATGAEDFVANLFTGHYRAVPVTTNCIQGNTFWTLSYFDITLSGPLTPTAAGSPLQGNAAGYQVSVLPDTSTLP
ncbi:MAG: hypothetical protein ACYDAY_08150 [Candidatus Dormibacteria bacterium]